MFNRRHLGKSSFGDFFNKKNSFLNAAGGLEDTRSATTNKFYVLPSRVDQQKNSFSRLGVRLWNALPENISKLKTKNLFKKRLRELLINILKTENSYPSTASIISKIKNI